MSLWNNLIHKYNHLIDQFIDLKLFFMFLIS